MARAKKTCVLIAGGIFIFIFVPFFGGALAQDAENDGPVIMKDSLFMSQEDIYAYWTPERMAEAGPVPEPEAVTPPGGDDPYQIQLETAAVAESLVPQVSLGWKPGSGSQPDPKVTYTVGEAYDPLETADFLTYGSAPTNPASGPYAPFQRWTWYGNYASQDTQTIGRLFFTDGTNNYACTASVIGRRTIATAGRCIAKGYNNGWYSGFLFCPSYYAGGKYPSRGCWSWSSATVSSQWYNSAAIDRDYGCIVTSSTGDTVSNKVGNVTGWIGRALNYPSMLPVFSWGYPFISPFPGYHIIVASSTEWYEVDMTPGDGQVSKYIGNDMTTGGAHGGPWWTGIAHRTAEYPVTDSRWETDPINANGPYIVGLNSHQRCRTNCSTPPTSTTGLFWQEWGSPQFKSTSASEEAEDVFQRCLSSE